MTYIEEYLEYICNNHLNSFESTNAIYYSIYKQTVRGLGLTDRQYALVTKKLSEYFDSIDHLPTKLPLRTIDRSKYIKLVDTADVYGIDRVYESYKAKWKWIKVRFPFSKKDIVKVDSIKIKSDEYHHEKGSHEHYYKFSGKNLYAIINVLDSRNFEIEEELLEYYKKTKQIKEREFDIFEKCLPDNVKQYLSTLTYLQKADRGHRYGYKLTKNTKDNIVEKIAFREETEVCLNPENYNLNDVVNTFNELDRFPILVLIDEEFSYTQLKQIHSEFSNYISNEAQSVMFRVDNKDDINSPLNQYVQDNNLNNWVDNTTKIVYIKKNKLPKVLLQSEFTPMTAFSKTSSRFHSNVQSYVNLFCDCIVYHDKNLSLFRRYSAYL